MNVTCLAPVALSAALLVPQLALAQDEPPAAVPTHTTTEPEASAQVSTTTSTSTATASNNAEGDAKADPGPHAGYKGFSFGFPTGGGPTVGGSYFLSDRMAVKLDLGLDLGKQAPSDDFLYGFSVEGGLRVYVHKAGRLSPFVQPGVFLAKAARDGDFGQLMALQVNAGVGAEYFFTDHLTAAALTGVGLRFADEFDTIKFTTGTSGIYVNLYW